MTSVFNATVAAASVAGTFITSVDGSQIFAQAVGDSRLPALVFIHGLALSALVWAKILQDTNLLRSFYLIAYDMRGHGRSAKPDTFEAYTSELYAQDFAAVTKAFNVEKPILVGWSLGAAVATDVTAHLGPDFLAGVIYTAALPWLDPNQNFGSDFFAALAPGLLTTNDSNLSLSTRIDFTNALFNHPENVPTEVLWSWLASTALQPPSRVGWLFAREQDTTQLFEAGRRGLPLLDVRGEDHRVLNNAKVLAALEGKFSDMMVHMFKNGSHVPFYENQAEYVREVVKFAKRVFKLK